MSKTSALTVAVAVGFSLWSCSDEQPGPGVGPETSWQIFCSDDDSTNACSSSEDPHGPLDGEEEDDKDDDFTFKTSCSNKGSGLTITIEDPGREANIPKKLKARARSILEINRGNPEDNRCFVTVTEYPIGQGPRVMQDTCEGTEAATGTYGTCTLTGDMDSNDYDFEGTIKCDGLRYKGMGPAAWVLRGARDQDAPVELQIANCK